MQGQWERLNTSMLPRNRRVQCWNEYGSETLSNMTVDPHECTDFVASLARISLGQIGMVHLSSTAAAAQSNGGAAGGWSTEERDALMLVLPERGTSIFEQTGRSIELAPGSMAIRDLSRPWIHRCYEPIDLVMVKLPFSMLAGRVHDIDGLIDTSFDVTDPIVAMTTGVLRSAREVLQTDPDGCWREEMSELIFHSLLLLTASASERHEITLDAGNRAAIRREAISFILDKLDDPDLSVAVVAEGLGVRVRTLQRAFFETGQSAKQIILAQRLDRAARELSGKGKGPARSILHVAFSVGFNDVSHFSRSFSRRFGVSPRQYRGTAVARRPKTSL